MTLHSRTLALVVAGTLVASTAQGQAPTVVIPNGTIGVQFEFVPFSVAPRPAAPQQVWISDAAPSLNCPMPVLRDNSSADSVMVVPQPATVPSVPMPGAGTNAGSWCHNPLGQPMRTFVW